MQLSSGLITEYFYNHNYEIFTQYLHVLKSKYEKDVNPMDLLDPSLLAAYKKLPHEQQQYINKLLSYYLTNIRFLDFGQFKASLGMLEYRKESKIIEANIIEMLTEKNNLVHGLDTKNNSQGFARIKYLEAEIEKSEKRKIILFNECKRKLESPLTTPKKEQRLGVIMLASTFSIVGIPIVLAGVGAAGAYQEIIHPNLYLKNSHVKFLLAKKIFKQIADKQRAGQPICELQAAAYLSFLSLSKGLYCVKQHLFKNKFSSQEQSELYAIAQYISQAFPQYLPVPPTRFLEPCPPLVQAKEEMPQTSSNVARTIKTLASATSSRTAVQTIPQRTMLKDRQGFNPLIHPERISEQRTHETEALPETSVCSGTYARSTSSRIW